MSPASSVDDVLEQTIAALASQPDVALVRIRLVAPPRHVARTRCRAREQGQDPRDRLRLVASSGRPTMSLGDFAGADAREWMDRPEWMRSERIRGFASHPLMFRGRLLGVLAVFARVPIDEARFSSLRLFAERAAAGIANAQARGNITELGR